MNYLLDTHYILWALFEPEKISENVRVIFQSEEHRKCVSGVNLWEISLKYSLGKLEFENLNPEQIAEKIDESGFVLIQVRNEDLLTYYQLPKKENHRDPFDRMLIWQAIKGGLTFISRDTKVEQYIENGLKVIVGT